MKLSASFEPACLIHYRATGEQEAILTLFTQNFGKMEVWVKERKALPSAVPLFKPLLLSWQESGSSFRLTHMELDTQNLALIKQDLSSEYLFSAFYLNELNYKLLPSLAETEDLYSSYLWALDSLAKQVFIEPILRIYERQLLAACGILNEITVDLMTGSEVVSGDRYRWMKHPQYGLGVTKASTDELQEYHSYPTNSNQTISGHSLLSFRNNTLNDSVVLAEVKQLMRWCVFASLDGKPLRSRSLFTSYKLK